MWRAIVGGMANRSVVLEALRLSSKDPALMDHVLRFAMENTAENCRGIRPCIISYTA